MDQLVLGTHHVALTPCGGEAFQRTLDFYCGILGLPVLRRWGEGESQAAMLDTGNSILEILPGNAPDAACSGSIPHFALEVSDVDRAAAAVRRAGYPITVEPKDLTLPTSPPFPIRIAFCRGPVGEELEFFQERRGE